MSAVLEKQLFNGVGLPGEPSVLVFAIEAVVVKPVATTRRKGTEADQRFDGTKFRIEIVPYEVAGVA